MAERIEVYFLKPISRAPLPQRFNLPQQPAAKTTNAEGKLVEYFGGQDLLALVCASADASSGVSLMGYYSPNLFEKVSGIRSEASQPSNPVAGNPSRCFAGDPGMIATDRTGHFNWAQRQSAAQLEANLANQIALFFNCPSLTDEQASSVFAELSVVIAHWLNNYPCFAGDPGALSQDESAHKAWASTRSRGEILNNLQWKMRTALKCMGRIGPKSSLFASMSVAIAKAALAGSGAASTQD